LGDDLRELSRVVAWADITSVKFLYQASFREVCYATGSRFSDLARVRVDSVDDRDDRGVTFVLPRRKNDRLGRGHHAGIRFANDDDVVDPATRLLEWVAVRGYRPGFLFPGWQAMCRGELNTPADYQAQLAADKTLGVVVGASLGTHSWRRGMVTTASEAGDDIVVIASRLGSQDLDTLSVYIAQADRYAHPVGKALGL
jgi:integrase